MMQSATLDTLAQNIKQIGLQLGFEQVAITDCQIDPYAEKYKQWLAKNYHGEMHYLHKHGENRYHADKIMSGTLTAIVVRLNYLPPNNIITKLLGNRQKAIISRYALGRDYHKVIKKKLNTLVLKINSLLEENSDAAKFRVFVDSGPVLEKALAEKAGLGWIGKHTNVINSKAGSWFFLGVVYTNLPLPIDQPESSHCGSCRACIDICPTQAIIAPYVLDATRCISYLTIELKGSIPVEFRKAMGNRVYGCDDCQLICPWNKFAKATNEKDFTPRHHLDDCELVTLFNWDEQTFLKNTEGSAIRRIGYEQWLRNLAIGLGNANTTPDVIHALKQKADHNALIVREHVNWALEQHAAK